MYFNCHTVFSFKYGTLSIEKLYAEAQRCGVQKIALTEINNTTSYIELLRLREEKKQTPPELPLLDIAVGIEFRNSHDLLYIALAKTITDSNK
jgi:DNA polymerase-3 subunit alpha